MSSPAPALPLAETALDRIGLLAGEGDFPLLIARAARERSVAVVAVGIRGVTSPRLEAEVDRMAWVRLGELDRVIQLLHEAGVGKTIMAGRIRHASIFDLGGIDGRGLRLLARLANKKADTILGALTEELSRERIEVLESTLFLRHCMPAQGLLTPSRPLSLAIRADVEFGLEHARRLAGLDIGQTVVVKSGAVVAVEAMEGTDATIRRAGEVAGPGCVVVKVSKPAQDRRFDVPVLGRTTVEHLVAARAVALAFPAREVLFFDQAEAVRLAEAEGISIAAV